MAEVFRRRQPGWRWIEPDLVALCTCIRCEHTGCEIHLDTSTLPLAVCKCGRYQPLAVLLKHDHLRQNDIDDLLTAGALESEPADFQPTHDRWPPSKTKSRPVRRLSGKDLI